MERNHRSGPAVDGGAARRAPGLEPGMHGLSAVPDATKPGGAGKGKYSSS